MLGLGVAQALTDVVGLPCVSFDSSSLFFSVALFCTQFIMIPPVEISRVDVFEIFPTDNESSECMVGVLHRSRLESERHPLLSCSQTTVET